MEKPLANSVFIYISHLRSLGLYFVASWAYPWEEEFRSGSAAHGDYVGILL